MDWILIEAILIVLVTILRNFNIAIESKLDIIQEDKRTPVLLGAIVQPDAHTRILKKRTPKMEVSPQQLASKRTLSIFFSPFNTISKSRLRLPLQRVVAERKPPLNLKNLINNNLWINPIASETSKSNVCGSICPSSLNTAQLNNLDILLIKSL